MSVKKEELDGNFTPMKSILYAVGKAEANELKLDFWGSTFLKVSAWLGMIIVTLGSFALLAIVCIALSKLGEFLF